MFDTSAIEPVPLTWVRAQPGPPAYVNVGDALSPLLLTLVSGRPVIPANFVEDRPRIAAIGTIGQNLRGGRVAVWGTGCSPWREPNGVGRTPYEPPSDTEIRLFATRGPLSARLLSRGRIRDVPFGDPAMLLPRFYTPSIKPRIELGVVIHLSELADREFVALPRPEIRRYRPPADGSVRLITMIAPPSVAALRTKIDEILACRRIVTTSLHGYALAAAYGRPCLYLGSDPGPGGPAYAALTGTGAERVNARFVDLLLGGGARDLVYWRQHKRAPTDWEALIRAVDAHAQPLEIDGEALVDACPAGVTPLAPAPASSIWEDPRVAALPLGAERARSSYWRRFKPLIVGRTG